MPCPVRPEANISHSRLRDGISPYGIEKISSNPPKGAINLLIDRTNLTTCAMRYPSLIGQYILTYPHTRSAQRINYIGSLPQDIDDVNT